MNNNNIIDDLNISVSSFDAISNQLSYLLDNFSKMTPTELDGSIMAIKYSTNNSKAHFIEILDKLEQFKKNGFQ